MRPVSRRKILGASLGGLLGAVACATEPRVAEGPQDKQKPVPEPKEQSQPATLAFSPEPGTDPETASPDAVAPSDGALEAADGGTEPGTEAVVCERVESVVGRNHGHELLVAEADVLAGLEKTYSLRGSSSHNHTLRISKEEFVRIGQGETLRKKTEFGAGHRHRILVRCRPEVLPPEQVNVCEAIIAGEDGHEVAIFESHVRGGIERRYDIQGVSGHSHVLVIRPEEFSRLLAGERLDLRTEFAAGHYHHAYIRYLGLTGVGSRGS